MKKTKRTLWLSIIAIALCALMLGGIIAVSYDALSDNEDEIVPSVDNENNLPVVKPKEEIDNSASASVEVTEDNKTVADVELESEDGEISASIPSGTLLDEGVSKVTLTIEKIDNSEANIEIKDNEATVSYNVHIEGVSSDNKTPIKVYVKELLPVGLNMGNYKFYHVENGATVEMTLLGDGEPVHNNFEYDSTTGDCVLYLASFSEIAVVNDTVNAWEGNFDYDFKLENDTYIISTADELAGLGAIVGGMNNQTRNSFAGKTIKLIADINLGDKDNANGSLIFHPIGYYYTDDNNGDGAKGDYYSTVKSFEGTFDGNGHTIANFYQNTWEIKGDYEGNYYSDAMGLFGYVVNGTVKNLTVNNFSSDGEFTPTGVIAAYAVNSTFENIAITECNPRVYNTGNGGIVGIGGNSDDPDTYKLTFTNITIDNSNKISALWGSWDVACGGLAGMFRGAGHAYMTNCHVAAQIDVYNDVCGNYQYYWYRYAGMMIGTNKNMITDDKGYTVPETAKFHAENCTVHFGDWNEYWYCELVANSIASYTHDHQFSRLEQIASLDEIKSGDTWLKAGNFLLISGNEKTCYHIVNKDGVLTQHLHTDAGEETVNGETVLKEDKTIVYLPFNQLFTGYGWGVKHIPVYNGEDYAFDGITILDREVADSRIKFDKAETAKDSYTTKTSVTIGELFKAATGVDVDILGANVQVTVSPVGENSTAGGTYASNADNWTQGTLEFTGLGQATITITDYYYCTPTTINVVIEDKQPVDKFKANSNLAFEHKLEDDTITVSLGDIFSAIEGAEINSTNVKVTIDNEALCTYVKNENDWTKSTLAFTGLGTVTISITDENYCNEAIANVTINNPADKDAFTVNFPNTAKYLYRVGNKNTITLGTLFEASLPDGAKATITVDNVSGGVTHTYNNNSDWTKGTIQFTGTGVVTITIDSDAFTSEKSLTVEVVNAKNITSAVGSTDTDIVVLSDLKIANDGVVYYNNCTVYGNGFEFNIVGGVNTQASNGTNYHGIINLTNVTLDNMVVVGEVYDKYGAYRNQEDYTAAINATESIIQNCHISNCSAPVRSKGNNTIIDTTLYGGTIACMIVEDGTNTLTNVTTVNYNDGRNVLGLGILISLEATNNVKLVLNGAFKQYNFVSQNDTACVPDANAKSIFDEMFSNSYSDYHIGNQPFVNTGILSMKDSFDANCISDNTTNGYEGKSVEMTAKAENGFPVTVNGYIYTMTSSGTVDNSYNANNDSHKATIQGDYLPTFNFDLGNQAIAGEDRYLKGDKNALEIRYLQGEEAITLDISKLASIFKYNDTNYTVTASYKDSNNNTIGTDCVITFSDAGSFTLVFTVEDNLFYNSNGVSLNKTVVREYKVPVSVVIAAPEIKDAVITIKNAAQSGSYSGLSDKTISFNPLNAITITDAEGTVDLTTNIASTNIEYASSSSAFAGATTITVTYNDGRVLKIILGKPTLNSPGSSKAITYGNDGTIKSSGAVASKSATGGTWTVTSYVFTGTNGKTVANNTVVTFTFPDKSCVTGDTLVTLADGSQKRIDEVTHTDSLLVWDFFTGDYACVPASIIFYHGDDNYDVINLSFDDGTVVKVINTHGFFDVDANEFVFIDEGNVEYFIGHNFVKVDGDSYTSVKLVEYTITEEFTGCYSIQSAQHNNFIVEGMFSETIPAYEGWFDYFEIGDNMKYDEAKMQEDIEKYGLYTYDDFSEYVTYEQFIAFSGPYLKVLVGRGVVTFDDILTLNFEYVK